MCVQKCCTIPNVLINKLHNDIKLLKYFQPNNQYYKKNVKIQEYFLLKFKMLNLSQHFVKGWNAFLKPPLE